MAYPYSVVSDPIIEISNLDFAYGQRLVLKHISLTVARGTTVGLIGPNGGGKTTLIKLLLGLLKPTRGTITVAGFPINVGQFVRLGLTGKIGILGKESADDLKHVQWLLGKVGIQELAEVPIGSLSGGELQRAYIARALAARPHVLLLDEPTTGIDRVGQDQFIEFLGDLRQSLSLTVILVSHDLRT